MAPEKIKAYQESSEAKSLHQIGKWLIATLIWLPFLLPVTALGFETLPLTTARTHLPAVFYREMSALVVLLWAVTGWITLKKGRLILLNILILILGILSAILIVFGGLEKSVAPPWLPLFILLGMLFAGSVAEALGYDDQGMLLDGVFTTALLFQLRKWQPPQVQPGFVRRHIQTGMRSVFLQAGILFLGLIYVIIIWIVFLGGWQVFQ